MQTEGVRLFVERAAAVQQEFRLTPENAPAVVDVCTQLDGMPLAIELAAARVKLLPVEEIAARLAGALGARFALLKGPSRAALPRHKVARWIRHALADDAEITVRIVDAEEGRTLNREYRKKDYATNVLTFDYAQEPVVMADLIICAPVIEQEADEQGKTLEAHYAHMLVHGTLHAQGWDHMKKKEAEAMEAREREILAALGFDDPYA